MPRYVKKEGIKNKDGTPKITGRPRKEVNVETLINLATIQCTDEEIACVLKISTDTLRDRFAEELKQARNAGKSSLRRVMWKKAIYDENVTMMIWLSKNLLNFSDKHVVESKGEEMENRLIIDFGEIKKPYRNQYAKDVNVAVRSDPQAAKEKIVEVLNGPEGKS